MNSINPPIVVGVDGSESAQRAVRWAAREALRRKASLRIAHVSPVIYSMPQSVSDRLAEEGLEWLRQGMRSAREAAPEIDISTVPHRGSPVEALIAESRSAQLMVLGSRGLGGFSGLLVGSVAVGLSNHAHCPVVVVRGEASSSQPVVVGIDGSPASEAAIGFAFEQASELRVPLVALHTWSDAVPFATYSMAYLVDWAEIEAEEQSVLAERLAGWQEKYPDVAVRRVVTRDQPSHSLLEQAKDAQLVVVGSRGRGGIKGMLLGSTSQAMVQHSACPVAVVRPEADH